MRQWKYIPEDERTSEDGYREAQRRIAAAREEGADLLDLSKLKLTKIPEEIPELAGLTTLRLSNNRLTDVGPLAGLTGLSELRLSGNQLTDVGPLAGLTGLTRLDLDRNQLTDVGPLAGLTGLTRLDLDRNQLTDVGPLAGLTGLTELSLNDNQLTDVGPLAGLTDLTGLDLSDNHLVDVGPLAGLTGLMTLGLYHNHLTDVGPLAGLTGLTGLFLNNNQLTDVGPLAGLTGLTNLYLYRNQLTDVGPLAGLTGLTNLYLYRNQLTDVGPLAGLTDLRVLWLNDNSITSLQPLRELLTMEPKLWFEFDIKDGIRLENCPLTDPPVEVARRGAGAVLRYWELIDRLGTFPNREGRILLVGNGASGKTSLQDKLFDDTTIIAKGVRRSTLGVNIKKDLPFVWEGKTYRARIWDFGGQVEQHAIHQYFFGRRSLYVVVIDRRSEEHYDHWLRIINLLGKRADRERTPVILLFNERDNDRKPQPTFNIDVYEPQYPDLELIPYSVDLGREDDESLPPEEQKGNDPRWPGFVDLLAREISQLPVMQDVLTPYARFPERLEQERAEGKAYLDWAAFGSICGELDLEFEPMWRDAATYLHAIGEVVHYGDLPEKSMLRRYVIIDIVWATEAIYKVLQLPDVVENKGAFTQVDLMAAWSDYDGDTRALLQELLLENAFEICFRLPSGGAFDYLAPGLLPEVDKVTNWKSRPGHLSFRLRYDGPVPTGIVARLIVRLHDLLDGERHYRYGAVFKDAKSDLRALVRLRRSRSGANNEIEIEVNERGGAATEFLAHLRTEFTRIHDQFFYGLRPKEIIACCCTACQPLTPTEKTDYVYQKLTSRLKAGKTEVWCDNLEEDISILEVLYGVYPQSDAQLVHLIKQNEKLRGLLEGIDQRGMRTAAQLAGVEETVSDTNLTVHENANALRHLNDALASVATDLERIEGNLFESGEERQRYFARVDDLLSALPPKDRPKPAGSADKDKIKVSLDLMKILGQYTPVAIEGLGLKHEWELDLAKAKLPRSWRDFRDWFVRVEEKT